MDILKTKIYREDLMGNQDTINLLKECDSGTKMAVASITEILDRIQDPKLKSLLTESREHHEQLGNDIHTLLSQHGSNDKEPNPLAKSMSWIKTNMKMGIDESDATAADLITDGCDMGVKSLYKYLNQYTEADLTSKGLCKKLISIEEKLCKDLRNYL